MRLIRQLTIAAVVALLALLVARPGAAVSATAASAATIDFNGDGFADLPVAVPGEDIGGLANAGRVVVMYGSHDGLTRGQGWHQNSPGVPDGNEAGDRFGEQLAAGDLDNDGYSDLAIAAPWEDGGAGAVTVLFGSATGLTPKDSVLLKDARNRDIKGARLGYILTIGNVDTAVFGRELIMGVVGDAVHIVRSVRSNLSLTVIKSGTHGLPAEDEGEPSSLKEVGCALAAGQFDAVAGDELLVGQAGTEASCWGWLMRGGAGGPSDPVWFGDRDPEHFGYANWGTCCPVEHPVVGRDTATGRGLVANYGYRGQVAVMMSDTDGGLDDRAWQVVDQETAGVPGTNEFHDYFAFGMALADVNVDGVLDFIVGTPGEGVGEVENAGTVSALHRRRDGSPASTGNYLWHQNKRWVPGSNDVNDLLGHGVHADDFDGDGIPDVVAYSRGERLDDQRTANPTAVPGVLTARYTRGGIHYRRIHQDLTSVPGSNQDGDQFGHSLGMP